MYEYLKAETRARNPDGREMANIFIVCHLVFQKCWVWFFILMNFCGVAWWLPEVLMLDAVSQTCLGM